MKYTIYFDKSLKSVDGVLTMQATEVVDGKTKVYTLFKRIPVKSGQQGFEGTNWVRGKSPIPFGKHKLSTKSVPLQMEPKGTPFFPIYSHSKDKNTIWSDDKKYKREAIGLHFDNQFPSSIGCVVSEPKLFKDLFDYLRNLNQKGVEEVEFVVL
jgi:hypothetical protein